MSRLCSFRLNKNVDGRDVDILVVFLAADELRPEELTSLVDEAVARDLAPDEMIVIARRTCADKVANMIGAAQECVGTRNRLGRATITVVGFGANGNEIGRQVVKGDAEVSRLGIREIGRRAVTSIFNDYGGFVEANANYHFLNPSGRHTDRFIRLSNLLVSSAEISLIAMTILPLLPTDAEVAHVDTPAMFAIVSALNDHLRTLAPKRPWMRCENFRSYLNVRRHDFTGGGKPVVLVSASSSGSMARIVRDRGIDEDRIGHVLYLGGDPSAVRCAIDLTYNVSSNPEGIADQRETFLEGGCDLCDKGSLPVPLKGDQFDMGGPDFEPLTMNKPDAPAGLDTTMSRLARSNALQVSTARGSKARQYFINIDRLLAAEAFVERTQYLARRYVPSTVRECILLDEGSRQFGELIMGEAEAAPRFLAREELDDLAGIDAGGDGKPLDGQPIVIVAGVIESGRSLRDISRDLRRSRPHSPQVYIVGVSKNPSPGKREELERTLIQTHGAAKHAFGAAEELLLPPSGSPNAWNAELDFLNAVRATGSDLSAALEARNHLLSQTSTPLVDDLFLATQNDPLRIQPGFVFWSAVLSEAADPTASQADVFFTVSSVLQRLRTNAPKPGGRALRTNWFQQTRLDPANLGRFNDGVIQASLLRAARPVEIDYSTQDEFASEAGRVLRRILEAAHKPRGEAASEVLIALGSRRLRLPRKELEDVLAERPSHPPIVAELAAACREALLG